MPTAAWARVRAPSPRRSRGDGGPTGSLPRAPPRRAGRRSSRRVCAVSITPRGMPSSAWPSGRLTEGWPVTFATGVNGIRPNSSSIQASAVSMRSSFWFGTPDAGAGAGVVGQRKTSYSSRKSPHLRVVEFITAAAASRSSAPSSRPWWTQAQDAASTFRRSVSRRLSRAKVPASPARSTDQMTARQARRSSSRTCGHASCTWCPSASSVAAAASTATRACGSVFMPKNDVAWIATRRGASLSPSASV